MADPAGENPKRGTGKSLLFFALIVIALSYFLFDGHTSGTVRKLTGEEFRQARASDAVVVAYFSAEWCGPCREQGPIVGKLAARFADGVIVGKIDVDAERELAGSLGISGIPKIIVFKNGREAARFRGLTAEAELAKTVQNLL